MKVLGERLEGYGEERSGQKLDLNVNIYIGKGPMEREKLTKMNVHGTGSGGFSSRR